MSIGLAVQRIITERIRIRGGKEVEIGRKGIFRQGKMPEALVEEESRR